MFAAVATLMAACSSDDGPNVKNTTIQLRSGVEGAVTRTLNQDLQSTQVANGQKVWVEFTTTAATPDQGTGTNAGEWSGTTATAVYTADGAGALSTTTMTKWPMASPSTETVDIKAWAPFAAAPSGTQSIKTDQSSEDDYKASDYLYGSRTGIVNSDIASPILVTFNHMLAKIVINVSSTVPNVDVQGSTVTFGNPAAANIVKDYTISNTDGSITPNITNKASIKVTGNLGADGKCACIIVPQTVSGMLFSINVPDPTDQLGTTAAAKTKTYSLPSPTTKAYDAGKVYTYNVAIRTDATLIVLNETITNWDAQTPEGVIAN